MIFFVFCIVSNLSEKGGLFLSIFHLVLSWIAIQWKEYSAPSKMVVLIARSMRKKAMNQRRRARVVIGGARFIIFV
jgi:hypothetical protein